MSTPLRLRKNLDQTRLSDAVYETLLEAILSGVIAPGSILSVLKVAAQLKVSRTPVHDALKQLAKDGLVEQRANHRAVVANFQPEDVHEVFDMRKLLECEAARRAAIRIDRPTLARLRAQADSLAGTRDDPNWVARWADFDEEFHDQIARGSGSRRLRQDIVRYRVFHRSFNRLATTVEVLQQALEEHRQILNALERRDPEGAAEAMRSHLQEWQAYFVNHFPRDGSRS